METKKILGLRIVAIIAAAVFASACDDGELKTGGGPEFDITPPSPIIAAFKADPSSIKAGEATTLSWEVAGADSVEITAISKGAPADFHVQTEELKGSAKVESLAATTDFTLTATKKIVVTEGEGEKGAEKKKAIALGKAEEKPSADLSPGTTSVSQTITVTVIEAGGGLEVKAKAEPPKVNSGEQSLLTWKVTPPEGVVVTVTADTGEPIVAFTKCEGSIPVILDQRPAETMPAEGCAVVTPATTTVYTVKAKTSDGTEQSALVTVEVIGGGINAEIYVNGQTEMTVDSFARPVSVEVSWIVEPSDAEVRITSEPQVTCDPPFDKAGSGPTTCTVKEETLFTIEASAGGETITASARVSLKGPSGGGGAAALVIADQWAFVGEEVTLKIALSQDSVPDIVEKVLLNGEPLAADQLTKLKSGDVSTPKVSVGRSGVQVKLLYGGGKEIPYRAVTGVSLIPKQPDYDVKAVTSEVFDQNIKHRYTGVMLDGFKSLPDGKPDLSFRIYKDGGALAPINFGDSIKGIDKQLQWRDEFFPALKTYPVVVAIREGTDSKPSEIFAATTGAVMRSKDEGKTWENVWVGLLQGDVNYKGPPSHATCGYDPSTTNHQKVQVWTQTDYTGQYVSLKQMCDMVIHPDGHLILATDHGVRVKNNIDADMNKAWLSVPPEGQKGSEVGALTFGHVVNDLEPVDDKTVFAGADHGVFLSKDGGIKWEKFGSIAGPIFALNYERRSKKLFAGTASGVQVASIDSDPSKASWAAVGDMKDPILTITIDPYSAADKPTIIVGTSKGVSITRDGGTSWNALAFEEAGEAKTAPVEVTRLAATKTKDGGITYAIAIGTADGREIYNSFDISVATSSPHPTSHTTPQER